MSTKKLTKSTQDETAHSGCPAVAGSPSSETPETDAAFEGIYKPPYRVGLARLAKLIGFVRRLEMARNHNRICIERMRQERLLLAKLAANASLSHGDESER